MKLSCSLQSLTRREEKRGNYADDYDGDDHGRPRGQSRYDRRYRGGQSPEEMQGNRKRCQEKAQRRRCRRSVQSLVNRLPQGYREQGALQMPPYFYSNSD